MKKTIEIKGVDLVRRIRDAQAAQLAGKSRAELMEFFNMAAKRATERSGRFRADSKTKSIDKMLRYKTSAAQKQGPIGY